MEYCIRSERLWVPHLFLAPFLWVRLLVGFQCSLECKSFSNLHLVKRCLFLSSFGPFLAFCIILSCLARCMKLILPIWATLPWFSLHRSSLTHYISLFACFLEFLLQCISLSESAFKPAARSSSPFWAAGTFQQSFLLPHTHQPDAFSPLPWTPSFKFHL